MSSAGTSAAGGALAAAATAARVEGELQECVLLLAGIPGLLLHLSNDHLTLPSPPCCAACLLAPPFLQAERHPQAAAGAADQPAAGAAGHHRHSIPPLGTRQRHAVRCLLLQQWPGQRMMRATMPSALECLPLIAYAAVTCAADPLACAVFGLFILQGAAGKGGGDPGAVPAAAEPQQQRPPGRGARHQQPRRQLR